MQKLEELASASCGEQSIHTVQYDVLIYLSTTVPSRAPVGGSLSDEILQ